MRKRVMSKTAYQYEEWDEYQCAKCGAILKIHDNYPQSICKKIAWRVNGIQVVCPDCHNEGERFVARMGIKSGPLQAAQLRKKQLEREIELIRLEIQGAEFMEKKCFEALAELEVIE